MSDGKWEMADVAVTSAIPAASFDPEGLAYSPGNAGRGRDEAQTFLMVMPGMRRVASAPARPIGAPRWMKCGSGRYGWLPVPIDEL